MAHSISLSQVARNCFLRGSFRLGAVMARGMSSDTPSYEHLNVSNPSSYVYQVTMNRPAKRNALNLQMWRELGECFDWLGSDKDCRVIILDGAGKMFCSGIDLGDLMRINSDLQDEVDVARKFKVIHHFVKRYQNWFNSIEKCPKPVLSAVHGSCIGGGINLISYTDIRFCAKDAIFCIKEVDMGLAADVGVLQRLPRIIGSHSLVRELAYTCRNMDADEALQCGLVSRVLPDHDALIAEAQQVAKTIAEKSPVAVQGTKINLLYSRDHSVQDGLDFNAFWSGAMLQSQDTVEAATAQLTKEPAKFSKL